MTRVCIRKKKQKKLFCVFYSVVQKLENPPPSPTATDNKVVSFLHLIDSEGWTSFLNKP